MEALEDTTCVSLSDSLSLYERYMRSFNVTGSYLDNAAVADQESSVSSCNNEEYNNEAKCSFLSENKLVDDPYKVEEEFAPAVVQSEFPNLIDSGSLHSSSSTSNLTDKSEVFHPSSESDSKSDFVIRPKPVIITSITAMENSNNAVDSVPLFSDVKQTENVFKLPASELSFNGTLKHVKKLKPIVDPISALTSANTLGKTDFLGQESNSADAIAHSSSDIENHNSMSRSDASLHHDTESTGDSQYQEVIPGNIPCFENNDQSYSSYEASFDSGVRSPDMFSEDEEPPVEPESFWSFLKDYESYDKMRVRKMEETLQGVLPPPSVTILKTNVEEMLKKYYCFLPVFNNENPTYQEQSKTPTKLTSYIKLPPHNETEKIEENNPNINLEQNTSTSSLDKTIKLNMCSESDAKDTGWPDLLKCKYHDINYNLTKYSERVELLAIKCGERFVGAETASSISVFSGGEMSPSSASKRKALRLKMAQAKSPGRRLSHLARRRQAFCSAATIGEKAHTSTSKMVLIDKKKFISLGERKSPRVKRTPGKKTPRKTPRKTPKTKSGGSSKKKAMRRLLIDPENLTRSQPTRETSRRALFQSPEDRKVPPVGSTSSVPHAIKSRRALFGSPVRQAETKSSDGSISDQFKRKFDQLGDSDIGNRCKIAKSLSFSGDSVSGSQVGLNRRASEMCGTRNMAELDEHHRKKLLWAVSEALRLHGWRMHSPGFREKASALARLTRRLLTLPSHAAKLNAPKISTSEFFYKIARQYVFAIIQGRTIEECFRDEQVRLSTETSKVTGYIPPNKNKPQTSSQIKENECDGVKQDLQKSNSKNVLQDKLINVDSNSCSSNSCSSLGMGMVDRAMLKSNSMPSFEEAAKMRARRQISFDNLDFPKR